MVKLTQYNNIFSTVIFLALLLILPGHTLLAVEAGDIAPEVELPLLPEGDKVSLSDYQGKIVYLDFWASWCPPCLVSMPVMNEMRNRLQRQGIAFEVLAVNVDADPEDGLDFLFDKPVDFIVLTDPDGQTPAQYGVKGMPTSYLINGEGRIALKHEGFRRSDAAMIEAEILRLVEQQQ